MTRTDRTISSAGGGAPDWDTSKKDVLFTNTNNVYGTRTIASKGYLLITYGNTIRHDDSSSWNVTVNSVSVISTYSGTADVPDVSVVVPVSVGDVVSWNSTAGAANDSHASITFYPAK